MFFKVNEDFLKKFEYPVLTRIHHRPDYRSLKILKDEIKANAASIYSDLGGGTHGHLGMVLKPPEYGHVLPIPYVCYLHHGLFV